MIIPAHAHLEVDPQTRAIDVLHPAHALLHGSDLNRLPDAMPSLREASD